MGTSRIVLFNHSLQKKTGKTSSTFAWCPNIWTRYRIPVGHSVTERLAPASILTINGVGISDTRVHCVRSASYVWHNQPAVEEHDRKGRETHNVSCRTILPILPDTPAYYSYYHKNVWICTWQFHGLRTGDLLILFDTPIWSDVVEKCTQLRVRRLATWRHQGYGRVIDSSMGFMELQTLANGLTRKLGLLGERGISFVPGIHLMLKFTHPCDYDNDTPQ